MIIKSSQRGGAASLAQHLVKNRDDDGIKQKIIVSGSRHLLGSRDVHRALTVMEMMAWASPATKKHLYHVSLNPSQEMSAEQWAHSWHRYEQEYGLEDHAYIEVTHIKKGRTHVHRAYERVDSDGKAIKLSFTKVRNEKIARILEKELGHPLTIGKHNRKIIQRLRQEDRHDVANWMEQGRAHKADRPVAEMKFEDYQQQRHSTIKKADVKAIVQKAYAETTGGKAFEQALIAHNLVLARGDRMSVVKDSQNKAVRDAKGEKLKLPAYVIVDAKGGTHSPRRILGVKVSELYLRWADLNPNHLPHVEQVKLERNIDRVPKVDKSKPEQALQRLQEEQARTDRRIVELERQLALEEQQQRRALAATAHTVGQQAAKAGRPITFVQRPAAVLASPQAEDADQRQLIEMLQHWPQMAAQQGRRESPVGLGKSHTGDGKQGHGDSSLNRHRQAEFFTSNVRHDLFKDYKPNYKRRIDPDNAHVIPEAPGTEGMKHGDLDAEVVLAIEAAAQYSRYRQPQLDKADTVRERVEHGDDLRFNGLATAPMEYLLELSRQRAAKGEDAVLRVATDMDIAIRLYGAGHTKAAVKRAIINESPIATALPGPAEQAAYVDKAIEPILRTDKVRWLRRSLDQMKRQQGRFGEMRLEPLNLSTEVPQQPLPPPPKPGHQPGLNPQL